MTPGELLRELARRGVKLTAHGDRLRYEAPPGALTLEMLAAMREHKAALVELLTWPPECQQAEALYHRPPVLVAPHARLFPLVGHRVETPQGPGVLLQVFQSVATVALDADPEHVTPFEPGEIRPLPGQGSGGAP